MHVLEDQQQRLARHRCAEDLSGKDLEGHAPLHRHADFRVRFLLGAMGRHDVHQHGRLLFVRLPGRLEQPAQLVASNLVGILRVHARDPVQIVLHRVERRVLVCRRALHREVADAALLVIVVPQRVDQPGFPDARLADQNGRRATPSCGGLPDHGTQ